MITEKDLMEYHWIDAAWRNQWNTISGVWINNNSKGVSKERIITTKDPIEHGIDAVWINDNSKGIPMEGMIRQRNQCRIPRVQYEETNGIPMDGMETAKKWMQ